MVGLSSKVESVRRYWLDAKNKTNESVTIDGDEFHHIFDVCRQDVGDQFEIILGDGLAYKVEVKVVGKKSAQAEIVAQRTLEQLERPYLKLCLSIPKLNIFDAVLEKAVELGAHSLQPLFSQNSFLKGEVSENRVERWSKIIKSATQQSGRSELMVLEPPRALQDVLQEFNRASDSLGLFLYEGEATLDIKSWAQAQPKTAQSIWVFIGSEGGFSQKEVQRFQEVKLDPVTLGNQVLRVETACLATLSVLKYEWNLMR